MGRAKGFGVAANGGSGSRLTMTVPGTLAIRSNAGQLPAFFTAATKLQGFRLAVSDAPTVTGLVVDVKLETSPEITLFTLTIPAGQVSVSATDIQILDAATIDAFVNLRIDILDVGTFPGANLTATAW
jgi:hypothetical protein